MRKYFPDISEEWLRREWQHYRHLEPDFDKWLKFMHDERERDSKPNKRDELNSYGIAAIALTAAAAVAGLYAIAIQ